MKALNNKQQRIISLFLEHEKLSSSAVHTLLQTGEDISLVTVKRELSELSNGDYLHVQGAGRSTEYEISSLGRLVANVDAAKYSAIDPDKRYGLDAYQFALFPTFPESIFSPEEQRKLDSATDEYVKRTKNLSSTIQKKELERLIIELSWKSSRIEGNTYTLLDTERLILEHKEALGHSKDEARMILNHKAAFLFIRDHLESYQTLNRSNLEKLHALLVKDLGVDSGLRSRPVGILGSKYRPLDNRHQIIEAIENLSLAITRAKTPYQKAMLAILGISYVQPFEDGNKRTSRLMANALLLAHGCAPLSYRSVDENEYREAILVFYELQSVMSFKKIFIDQYTFAARNYTI